MKNFNMKLPVETGSATCKPESGEATASRKRPRSAANGGGPGLRPPSRAMPPGSALSWGQALHCAPQIAIPDSRLHLTASNRPRSRFNSVRKVIYFSPSMFLKITLWSILSPT